MKSIEKSARTVVNIHTATFRPFVFAGETLPGQSFLQLDDTFPEGSGFHIYRMEAGSTSQPHEHTCHEQFLVLEGELIDHDGYVYRPGDFALLQRGTQHSSHTLTGATLAVFIRTPETMA
ncbi:MAG: cupin domain-containing protein [Pseudomonadota bacterium]|nr:cupin domain-containing protein [Pseudomonadota bacterium]